jgi:hypothetical protein
MRGAPSAAQRGSNLASAIGGGVRRVALPPPVCGESSVVHRRGSRTAAAASSIAPRDAWWCSEDGLVTVVNEDLKLARDLASR